MTTFQEMYDLTVNITKRPELVPMTKQAVRAATLKAHTTDFFHRDGYAGLITYAIDNTKTWVDIADIYTELPRLRGIKFVQCVNSITNAPTEQLFYVDSTDVYDKDGYAKRSIFTLRGSGLRLYPIAQTGKFDVDCFLLPITTELGYNSWIANDFPEELALWAAMIIQHRIGNMEQAKATASLHVAPFREMLMETYVVPVIN